MTPVDLRAANKLADQWRGGDYQVWPALKVYVEKRASEDVSRHFKHLDDTQRERYKKMVPDLHNILLGQDRLDPKGMSSFHEYCSRLVRLALVEITKRERVGSERGEAGDPC